MLLSMTICAKFHLHPLQSLLTIVTVISNSESKHETDAMAVRARTKRTGATRKTPDWDKRVKLNKKTNRTKQHNFKFRQTPPTSEISVTRLGLHDRSQCTTSLREPACKRKRVKVGA